MKKDESAAMRFWGQIIDHVNGNNDGDQVSADCSVADMAFIRMLILIGTCLGFTFASADIKGAYIQSGPITREVSVRLPREFGRKRGILWRLLKLLYGLVNEGRQWAVKIEGWMLLESKLERLF